jgi:hypothetical protein
MKKNYFLLAVSVIIILSAVILRFQQIINNKSQESNDNKPEMEILLDEQNEKDIFEDDVAIVGNDRDEHGCIGSAGYTWCESKQKCLRIWEEDCPVEISDKYENRFKPPIEVVVTSPLPGEKVSSPLEIKGTARGYWFFEAVLPLKLLTAAGDIVVDYYAQAETDWMTEDFVAFSTILDFNTEAENGYLVIMKSNPSGLLENSAQISIPIKFK